jgi:catechol 2,3-dioxygenase-like lactoylglutathione lyase family enzyme
MMRTPPFPRLKPLLGEVRQLGYVVKDLEAACAFWTGVLNVGPFVVIEEGIGDRDYMHRGRETDVGFKLGFCYCGDVQVEFVQQIGAAPSPYSEFLAQGREGLHHMAFFPDDYEQARAELLRRGLSEIACVQTRDGVRQNSFFEGPPEVGYLIELTPVTLERARYYNAFKVLAENWDGSRPVRRFANRAEFMASEDCQV